MHRWWHDLNPIWIGTAIGISLGILAEIAFCVFEVEDSRLYVSGWGYDGYGGGEASLHTFPLILITFGFFLGLLVLLRRKAKAWKP